MSEELDEVRRRLEVARERRGVVRDELEGTRSSADYITRSTATVQLRQVETEIAELELRERGLVDELTVREAAIAEVQERVKAEERGFWFRRFHTSLAIANGGAIAAISSKLLDKDVDHLAVKVALIPMTIFSAGLVLAGLIPFILYDQRRTGAQVLANLSSALFVAGLAATIAGLGYYAFQPGAHAIKPPPSRSQPATVLQRPQPQIPAKP